MRSGAGNDPEILARAGETLLVCEDEKSVRDLVEQMLRVAGYAVLATATGSEAIAAAREHAGRLDLLIADVFMPDLDGQRVAEAVGEIRPGIRTLYISGYPAKLVAQRGLVVESAAFLEKPFTRTELLQRVRRLIDGASGRAAMLHASSEQAVS